MNEQKVFFGRGAMCWAILLTLLAAPGAVGANSAPELYQPGTVQIGIWYDETISYPRWMGMDGDGNVYVADPGLYAVQKFDGVSWTEFSDGAGTSYGSFYLPFGVAVAASGQVYVTDRDNHVVVRLNAEGGFDAEWGTSGSSSSDVGKFDSPCGMALDASGNLYVADKYNDRIQKFDGSAWTEFVNSGLSEPQDVAVDSSGNVYVADKQNDMIRKYQSSGALAISWDSSVGAPEDYTHPSSLTVAADGRIHVTHGGGTNDQAIYVYNAAGVFQYAWGGGLVSRAFDVLFDGAGDAFVSDPYDGVIYKYAFDPLRKDSVDVAMSIDGAPIPFDLTLDALDGDGDTLTWSVTSPPAHGAADAAGTGDAIAVDYTPPALFTGADSFEVTVADGNGGADSITVNVAVDCPPNLGVSEALNNNAETDSGGDEEPQLVTDGAGRWIAVWGSSEDIGGAGTDTDILYAVSDDDGATWTDPSVLDSNAIGDSSTDNDVQLATDGAGNWIAVWVSKESGIGPDNDIFFAVSDDNGDTWSAGAAVSSWATLDSGHDWYPRVTTDGAGVWIVVWMSYDEHGSLGTDGDILYARTEDNGATWTEMDALNNNAATDTSSGGDELPQLATDGAGTWIAIWRSKTDLGGAGTDWDVFYAVSDDDGDTWTDPAALNSNAGTDSRDDHNPRLTTDGAGTWIAIWRSTYNLGETIGDDMDLFFAVSDDDGATWTAPAVLNSNADSDESSEEAPQIATDGAGNWIALWGSLDTSNGPKDQEVDIYYALSQDNGTTWGDMALLANNEAHTDARTDNNPQLATDGAGVWIAVWNSYENGVSDYDIHFTSSLNFAPEIEQGAEPLAVSMSEDGTPSDWAEPTLSATDVNDEPLSWDVLTAPENGVANVSGVGPSPATFTYNPDANYFGVDSFVVRVTDGELTDTITVQVTVSSVIDAPDVTWPTAGDIVYEQTLADAVLTGGAANLGGAAVAGAFAFDAPTTAPDVGTASHAMTFTPDDAANFSTVAGGSVSVTVAKATPSVSAWPSAAEITEGQTLADATLSGGAASVSGSFDYEAPTTIPSAGTYSAAVRFLPDDTANFMTVLGSVDVLVIAPVASEGETTEGEGETAEGEGETDAEGEGETTEGEGETDAEGEGETDAEGEGETVAEGEGETVAEGEGDAEGEGETDAEGEGETVAEGEGETDAEGEGETVAEGEGETDAEGEGEAEESSGLCSSTSEKNWRANLGDWLWLSVGLAALLVSRRTVAKERK
jgi:hypothetical protein